MDGNKELLALTAQADAIDGEIESNYALHDAGQEDGAQPGAAEVVTSEEDEALTLLVVARELITPALPMLRPVYDDATLQQIAQAAGPVMRKYGWSAGGLSAWSEEIRLAVVLVPVGMATVAAIREARAAAQAKEVQSDAQAASTAA